MKYQLAAHFFKDQSGTTVIEYALIGALISVACVGGMTFVAGELLGLYTTVSTAVTAALAG